MKWLPSPLSRCPPHENPEEQLHQGPGRWGKGGGFGPPYSNLLLSRSSKTRIMLSYVEKGNATFVENCLSFQPRA